MKELTREEIIEAIKALTEVVKANNNLIFGSGRLVDEANEKISKLIKKL